MNWVQQLYPGDQAGWAAALVIIQVAAATLLSLCLAATVARRDAARRYVLYLAALTVIVASPVITAAAYRLDLSLFKIPTAWLHEKPTPATPEDPGSTALTIEAKPVAGPHTPEPEPVDEPSVAVGPVESPAPAPAPAPVALNTALRKTGDALTRAETVRAAFAFLLLGWAIGSVILLLRFGFGWAVLARLAGRSRPLRDRTIRSVHGRVCRALGVTGLPGIKTSGEVSSPVVVGFIRPVVVLPEGFCSSLSRSQLACVLIHECAHILRRDPQVHLLQRIAEILFWPVPMVRLLNRRLSAACEEVCDNHVLRQARPEAYARTLVDLAERGPVFRRALSPVGFLPAAGRMERRVRDILDNRRKTMIRTNRWVALATVAVFHLTAVAVAGARTGQHSGKARSPASKASKSLETEIERMVRSARAFADSARRILEELKKSTAAPPGTPKTRTAPTPPAPPTRRTAPTLPAPPTRRTAPTPPARRIRRIMARIKRRTAHEKRRHAERVQRHKERMQRHKERMKRHKDRMRRHRERMHRHRERMQRHRERMQRHNERIRRRIRVRMKRIAGALKFKLKAKAFRKKMKLLRRKTMEQVTRDLQKMKTMGLNDRMKLLRRRAMEMKLKARQFEQTLKKELKRLGDDLKRDLMRDLKRMKRDLKRMKRIGRTPGSPPAPAAPAPRPVPRPSR